MKRFTFAAMFSVSIFAVWMIFLGPSLSPSKTNSDHPALQKVVDEMPKNYSNWMIAPVFDASGAVISNPSGMMLNPTSLKNNPVPVTGVDRTIAPVFDANGAVVSDPSGTILNKSNP